MTVSLVEGTSKWVRSLSVNTDGNLVIDDQLTLFELLPELQAGVKL